MVKVENIKKMLIGKDINLFFDTIKIKAKIVEILSFVNPTSKLNKNELVSYSKSNIMGVLVAPPFRVLVIDCRGKRNTKKIEIHVKLAYGKGAFFEAILLYNYDYFKKNSLKN